MNKQQIITYLKKYNFNSDDYVVISGAAMVILGIKDSTNDIDIAVTKELYDELTKYDECVYETKDKNNDNVYFIGKINFGKMYFDSSKIYIDSIPIQSIEQIKQLKKSLNRPKDKLDLELIATFEKTII